MRHLSLVLILATLLGRGTAQLTWSNRTPILSPTGRGSHPLAFDEARGRAVLFGGRLLTGDTWEWDGNAWSHIITAVSPPPRFLHTLAYDGARNRTVLFGGGTYSHQRFADTWEWDGAMWSHIITTTTPAARYGHAMVFDSLRQRVILFGGLDVTNTSLSDTWSWDGSMWMRLLSPSSPPARSQASFCYDTRRHVAVLFGGYSYTAGLLDDTWEWNGTTWSQRMPVQRPTARYEHALAYDEARDRTVLFGGGTGGGAVSSETWEWDGSAWSQLTTSSSPPARSGHAMVYDARRRAPLVFGGYSDATGYLSDTWELRASSSGPIQVSGTVVMRAAQGTLTPLAGVTVAVLQNQQLQGPPTTTSASGTYAITLPSTSLPGRYTIRATLRFPGTLVHPDVINYCYPSSGQVPILQPDQDQIALFPGANAALDIHYPQPVVFVHGIWFSDTWDSARDLLRETPESKSLRGIAHRSFPAWSVQYGAFHDTRTHEQNAVALAQQVAQIRQAWGGVLPPRTTLDMVCHSLGGIVARAYLPTTLPGEIDRIITLGTPHMGCWFLFGESRSPTWTQQRVALQQMDPLYMATEFPVIAHTTQTARFILVGSSINWLIEPEAYFGLLFPHYPNPPGPRDDGFVSTWSSLDEWGYLRLPTRATLVMPNLHLDMTRNYGTQLRVMDWLEQYR